jgi:hypothetical protein
MNTGTSALRQGGWNLKLTIHLKLQFADLSVSNSSFISRSLGIEGSPPVLYLWLEFEI